LRKLLNQAPKPLYNSIHDEKRLFAIGFLSRGKIDIFIQKACVFQADLDRIA
jgi:hypothetical protein